jgi:cell wall-associated NlpC family hydrolase
MSEPLDPALWCDLIGKPFVDGARGPEHYDCFGLLLEVYRRRGIVILDHSYSDDPAERAARLLRGLTSWTPCEIRPGVGLLFREKGIAGHVGVALDEDRFIHAAHYIGQVGIGFLSRGWRSLLIGAYEPSQD